MRWKPWIIGTAAAVLISAELAHQLLPPDQAVAQAKVSCPDLSQSCQFELAGQTFRLQAASPPSGLRPFELTLTGPSQQARAHFSMIGMEMGPNGYQLRAAGSQQLKASVILPVCSQRRLDWLLTLELDQGRVDVTFTAQR
ncbi:hypothetical protein [Parachitinimonas caeni]|uniref:Uncharacterized protein n=1 Tax=Parachitinimonas caeni TaxID=3031301 RepID=A0ABT7DWS6_9NEIS|nr:hypothetical protein [Parachitinimonas caeni]MDK2123102.1 hypothetical protein [Parachitinimonas caeni]